MKAAVTSDGSLAGDRRPGLPRRTAGGADRAPRLTRDQAIATARGVIGRPTAGRRCPTRRRSFGSPRSACPRSRGRPPRRSLRRRWTARSSTRAPEPCCGATTSWRSDQTGTGLAWPYAPGPFPNGGGVAVPVTFPVTGATALSGNNAHVYTSIRADDEIDPGRRDPGQQPRDARLALPGLAEHDDRGTELQLDLPLHVGPLHAVQLAGEPQPGVRPGLRAPAEPVHDHLEAAPIGFTEAAGNFQVTNDDGHGGAAGDPVLAETLVGANLFGDGRPQFFNNASMYTPRDGTVAAAVAPAVPTGRLGSRRSPRPMRADDASVVFHEYTHGLSSRLVTMPDGRPRALRRSVRRDGRGVERLVRAGCARRRTATRPTRARWTSRSVPG